MNNEFQIEIIKKKFGNSEEFSVSARELHKALEVKKDFSNWFKAQIKRGMFDENIDFITITQKGDGQIRRNSRGLLIDKKGKVIPIEYYITLDTAKHIAMMSGTIKGKEVRKYFIRIEKEYIRLMMEKFPKGALLDWQKSRIDGKVHRRSLTDTIQRFIKYAEDQGSKNAYFYYSTITIATYKALTLIEKTEDIGDNFRDTLEAIHLSFLGTAENIALEVMENEMEKGTPYKDIFQIAKAKVIEFATVIIPVLELKPREKIEVKSKQGTFEF